MKRKVGQLVPVSRPIREAARFVDLTVRRTLKGWLVVI
jgi:hypothetical protein